MKVIRGISPDLYPASVVTMGMFDGVHRGHQVLINACRESAKKQNLPAIVLTYEPHPSKLLHPEQQALLLTTLSEKLALLEQAGIDVVVIPDFTREFSELNAEAFLREVLVASLHPQTLVVGYRTTFGHDRGGNAELLRSKAQQLGFTAEIVEPIIIADGAVSSSRIRSSLLAGELELANTLLGYKYKLSGKVTHGDGRGHSLGISTANIVPPIDKLVPAEGVYAVNVSLVDSNYRGVMNIGERPTFGRPFSLEVHLLDYQGDLYDHELTVTFAKYLRPVSYFTSSAELKDQIDIDIAQTRALDQM